MRTLTRQEAAERAGLIAVEAYDVELDFTTGATTFRSTTRLRFDCRQPGATTFVELLASGRPSVRLNGHILDDGVYDGERISLRTSMRRTSSSSKRTASYTDTGEGMHRFVDPEDGETYLYSNAFLYEAQRIFACFDQPDLKATFELRVIAPDGLDCPGQRGGIRDGARSLGVRADPAAVDVPHRGLRGTIRIVWECPRRHPACGALPAVDGAVRRGRRHARRRAGGTRLLS